METANNIAGLFDMLLLIAAVVSVGLIIRFRKGKR